MGRRSAAGDLTWRCGQYHQYDLPPCMDVRALTTAIAASAVLGCPAAEPNRASERDTSASAAADSVAPTSPPWYRRAWALDLTGDGRADSVRLDAAGARPDSLRITLSRR